MTYDPNQRPGMDPNRSKTMGWAIGGIVALALIIGGIWAMTNSDNAGTGTAQQGSSTSTTGQGSPPASSPGSPSGSGSSSGAR